MALVDLTNAERAILWQLAEDEINRLNDGDYDLDTRAIIRRVVNLVRIQNKVAPE
jgi:hypothetical protein